MPIQTIDFNYKSVVKQMYDFMIYFIIFLNELNISHIMFSNKYSIWKRYEQYEQYNICYCLSNENNVFIFMMLLK